MALPFSLSPLASMTTLLLTFAILLSPAVTGYESISTHGWYCVWDNSRSDLDSECLLGTCRFRPDAGTLLQSSRGSAPLSCMHLPRGALLSTCGSSDDGITSHNKVCSSSNILCTPTDASCCSSDCPEPQQKQHSHAATHVVQAAGGNLPRDDMGTQQQALLLPLRVAPAFNSPISNSDATVTWASRLKAANRGAQPTSGGPRPLQCQASAPKPSLPVPLPPVSISARRSEQCSAASSAESGMVTPAQGYTECFPFARAASPRSPSSTLSAESHTFAAAGAPPPHTTAGVEGHSATASAHCAACHASRGEAAAAVVGAAAVHHRAALLEDQVIPLLCPTHAACCQTFASTILCMKV